MINAQTNQLSIQVSLLILLGIVCVTSLFGMFLRPENISVFLIVFAISVVGIVIFFSPTQVKRLSFSIKGVEAELRKVQKVVDDQQTTINKLVTYSLAEIIYRELLWKIGHGIEVTCDCTNDQQRWLILLFDHGLLQAKDWSQWKAFDQISKGQNFSEIFAPTPAAEYLMQLRGPPK